MRRIKLIVTGDVEEVALHGSLRRMFPSTDSEGEEVVWLQPRKMNCATSSRLRADSPTPGKPLKDLAQAMLDEGLLGKRGQPADLVVVLDDVELGNVGREEIIANQFRVAVAEKLERVGRDSGQYERSRYQQALRTKCSFHMIKPMIEAYFFGDQTTLQRLGVAGHWPLAHDDVEEFENLEPEWVARCVVPNQNVRRQRDRQWWRQERHPKHYLEYLLSKQGKDYDEVRDGKKALENLAWKAVPKSPQCCCFLRSLFEDIADWYGVLNPLGPDGCHAADFYPHRSIDRETLLLRNM